MANELVTNAVEASSPDQMITLRLYLRDGGFPMLEVWDEVNDLPRLTYAATDDESGRGLPLVEAFVHNWGVNRVAGGGKVVWAELNQE